MTASPVIVSPSRRLLIGSLGSLVAGCVVLGVASLGACSGKVTSAPTAFVSGGPATPLTSAEVFRIIERAILSIESATGSPTTDIHVAVTARTGDILGVYSTTGPGASDGANIAVGLARTTSFFSNSQAPLSSRTVETLSTFHFPPTFSEELIPSQVPISGAGNTVIPPRRRTAGVAGTPQGPLWQIDATNRGADIATAATFPVTAFNTGNAQPGPPGEPLPDPLAANIVFFPSRNTDGTFPSPGICPIPGSVPLFKANANGVPRLVGGVGVYVVNTSGPNLGSPNVAAGEYAAIQGASGSGAFGDEDFFFDDIPLEGAITIVGILLPYVKQTTLPQGFTARVNTAPGGFVVAPANGRPDPFGYLIGPRAAQSGFGGELLSNADVQLIIEQVVDSANITRGQVRLPLGSSSKVIATIVDTRGLILAHYRMEDTLCDAIDVVPAKARSTVYYCMPSTDPRSAFANGDTWPGFPVGDPRGIALTTRTLGFVSQPFYPPGIGGTFSQQEYLAALPSFTPAPGNTAPGPLFDLALQNQLPTQVDRWGNSAPDPGYQNGLTFFPGSVPLYKNGQLVGALGVSGDGVEQNDLIAFEGGAGFEPPPELRIDNFEFQGVKLPYLKFPETPR